MAPFSGVPAPRFETMVAAPPRVHTGRRLPGPFALLEAVHQCRAAVFAHCAAHSGVAVWQLQRSIPIVRAWRESRGSVSALDCRTVRQRRLTSSFRLDSPARNLPTLSPAYAGAGSAPPPCSPRTGSQPHPL